MSGCQDKSYRCIWKDTCQMGFRKQTKYCEIHKDPRSIWRTSFYQCVLWELLGKLKENSFTINHSNNCIECSHIQDECNFLTLLQIIFFFFFSISDPLYLYPFTFPSQTHSSEWVKPLKNPSALPELLGCFACLLTGQPIHIQHFCQHHQRNEKKDLCYWGMGEGHRSNSWLSCRSSIFGQIRFSKQIFQTFHIWKTGQWPGQNPVP